MTNKDRDLVLSYLHDRAYKHGLHNVEDKEECKRILVECIEYSLDNNLSELPELIVSCIDSMRFGYQDYLSGSKLN